MRYGETITVTRPGEPTGGFDDLGNPVVSGPSTFTVEGVVVAPLTPQEEIELFGSVNRGGYTLYMPYGSELRSSDTVMVRAEAGLQVQGDASKVQYRSPFTGWEAGAVAIVRRAS